MQRTGLAAIEQNLVKDHDPAHVRPASYDLSVGEVYHQGALLTPAVVQPQQIVVIGSKETVEVPPGFVGYAMPKTSLCNEGILVFNTGIVDPGYKGRLSTVAINFSRTPIPLDPGREFLRLVLHKLEGTGSDRRDETLTPDSVALFTRRSVNYPPTFLDVPGQTDRLIREITSDVVDRQRNAVLLLISAIGFMFVLWNFASYFMLSRQANVIAERAMQSEVKAMDFAKLQLEVDGLRADVTRLRQTAAGQQPAKSK